MRFAIACRSLNESIEACAFITPDSNVRRIATGVFARSVAIGGMRAAAAFWDSWQVAHCFLNKAAA